LLVYLFLQENLLAEDDAIDFEKIEQSLSFSNDAVAYARASDIMEVDNVSLLLRF